MSSPTTTHVIGVCHMAFFTDPDGNALMLHQRCAPRA
jgi:predicted enzyme related to lactoylglutathione lyase